MTVQPSSSALGSSRIARAAQNPHPPRFCPPLLLVPTLVLVGVSAVIMLVVVQSSGTPSVQTHT